jgi:hypothetical protein
MTEQPNRPDLASCAHMVIHYRTEPAEHGTVRGYWACATCQRRTSDPFARIPEQAEPAATGGGDVELREVAESVWLASHHATVEASWSEDGWKDAVEERLAELRTEPASPSRGGGEPQDERRADEAFPDAYALIGPGYDRDVAPAFSNEARVVNVYTACLALHRALENGRELGRIAAERQAYIDRMTPLWSKSQPPTDGLRERVEAVIYDIEGTFEAALATPSPAMRALLDRLRAALAATQPEAPDAEVGS